MLDFLWYRINLRLWRNLSFIGVYLDRGLVCGLVEYCRKLLIVKLMLFFFFLFVSVLNFWGF